MYFSKQSRYYFKINSPPENFFVLMALQLVKAFTYIVAQRVAVPFTRAYKKPVHTIPVKVNEIKK